MPKSGAGVGALMESDVSGRIQIDKSTDGGWGGRIRTFNLLIQSDPRYRK